MQEEDVCDRDGCDGLGGASTYSNEDTPSKEATITLFEDEPDTAGKVDCIARHVDGASSEFVRKGYPDKVADTLQ